MKKAIFRRFFLVILIALLICSAVSSIIISNTLLHDNIQNMLQNLHLVDYDLDYTGDLQTQLDEINPSVMMNNTRLTVLDQDGAVLADTAANNPTHLENHLNREEIEEAIQTGYGSSSRYSSTLKKQMLYVSYSSSKSESILRLSIPYSGIWQYLTLLLPGVLISIAAAILISLFFANKFAKSITDPLKEISSELLKIQDSRQDFHFSDYEYDELNQIVVTTAKLSDQIQKNVSKLRMERSKIDYILSNMIEGFLLLDENQKVLTVNLSARSMLDCPDTEQGQHITSYTKKAPLLEAVDQAAQGKQRSSFDLMLNDDRICSVSITTIQKSVFFDHHSGIVILLVDVTNDRSNQRIRQEFFSNVSHELKTPITSIQGFAELLDSDMVTDEASKKEFFLRIKKETQNMTNLINDILMISKLESRQHEVVFSPVKVKLLIEELVVSLSPVAQLNEVTISLDCDDVIYQANPQQLHQLVNNLLSNAVKYNKQGGSVSITVRKTKQELILTVSDTGIGIPKAAQGRIFERFYRVDKGRSKKQGGTGLGLSIVKHIVQFYNGIIVLESIPDVGTSITVHLPITENEEPDN